MKRASTSAAYVAVLCIAVSFACPAWAQSVQSAHPKAEPAKCIRVVDGDTIIVLLHGRRERVRLIGVDTPETVRPDTSVQYYGKEAAAFTRRMAAGKRVWLEYDWERRDKYGRLLAYVYLDDGTFLNAELIRQGYGHAYTRFPFRYMEQFRRYERQARQERRGLWGRPR